MRRAINEDNADECDRCAAQIIRLVRAAAWCVSSPAAGEQAARELGIEEVLDE